MHTNKLTIGLSAVALILLTLLIISLNSSRIDEQSRSNLIALGKAEQIQRQLTVLSTTASTYLEVAPREYDQFFRDVEVLHPTLMAVVESLGTAYDSLETLSLDPNLNHQIVADEWRTFRGELDEQLGVDPDFPRLEWGARHISEKLPPLIASMDGLYSSLVGDSQS
ncbi:MAG: hypothetical protein AAGH65_09810 [Pseudomonadota bacterium]